MVSSKRKMVIFVFLGMMLVAIGGVYLFSMGKEKTDDATLEADVATISPKVSGYIKTVLVEDNQMVKAGDVLAEIDPEEYQIALDGAEAALEAAKARAAGSVQSFESTRVSAPSAQLAAEAQVKQAQALWENALITLKRVRSLSDMARSKQQLDDAVAEEKRTAGALNDAKARLESAKTAPQTIAVAQSATDENSALVKEAETAVALAKKNLLDTKIIAPFDGRVTSRGVVEGNFVQPGQNLMSVVGKTFWVIANFKETQLSDMKIGQQADIEVDAYPDLRLTGKVDSIQAGTGASFSVFPPQNATGNFVKIVQRVPVKITLDPVPSEDVELGVGLSVVPTVHTGEGIIK